VIRDCQALERNPAPIAERRIMSASQYAEYLKSGHWLALVHTVRCARRVCERCGTDAPTALREYGQTLNVHHLNYARLGAELQTDLVLLCWRCHMKEHGLAGWVDFCQSKAMPRISEPCRLSCANCGATNGPPAYNFDEITEWFCRECS
jgi:HNH endonuclease